MGTFRDDSVQTDFMDIVGITSWVFRKGGWYYFNTASGGKYTKLFQQQKGYHRKIKVF